MKINNNISEWVEKAEGDYEAVLDLRKKRRKRQRYIIAFHCQQCIEKYLKALPAFHKIDFPKQHDLEELLVLLLPKQPLLVCLRNELKQLTPFAVAFRYPGEEINSAELKEAVKIMKHLRIILRDRLKL